MKDVLIVFGILLLLLILISAFGGSIRYTAEYFVDGPSPEKQTQKEKSDQKSEHKVEEKIVEGFDGDAYAGVPESENAEGFAEIPRRKLKPQTKHTNPNAPVNN